MPSWAVTATAAMVRAESSPCAGAATAISCSGVSGSASAGETTTRAPAWVPAALTVTLAVSCSTLAV